MFQIIINPDYCHLYLQYLKIHLSQRTLEIAMNDPLFENREEAGKQLSKRLNDYKNSNAIVLAIPRGGVTVGYAIAKKLNLLLDVVLVKKIGHPQNHEYAIGAVSLEDSIISDTNDVSGEYIEEETTKLRKTLKERYLRYSPFRPAIKEIKDKTVILVDDGIATGNTMLATVKLLRKGMSKRIIIAVPVIPSDKVAQFNHEVDELIYLSAPGYFPGVGAFYNDFTQVSDEDAIEMLKEINSKILT